jgi:hypothetical protein
LRLREAADLEPDREADDLEPGRVFARMVRIVRDNDAPSTGSDTADYLRRILCEEPGQDGRPTLR